MLCEIPWHTQKNKNRKEEYSMAEKGPRSDEGAAWKHTKKQQKEF